MFSDKFCDQLRDAFREARYEPDAVVDLLGAQAHAALGRGEPEPARRASADAGALGSLIRLFLLGDAVSSTETAAALGTLSVADAVTEGLLREVDGNLRADLDVRPYGDDQGSWWVVSDQDSDLRGAPVGPDHVLGVGHASLSLARATARRPVDTVLDLGTGCGVQALHAARHANRVTATDLSERALSLASATFRLNE
ncbi:methyltransferase, partial [Kutzneria sp. 744]|uniref:DUF7059 domain-containing protein n=1 Tax=Kutzneria sp. (strain 744) TaxID=345341 RepID=UPI0003EEBC0C